MAQGHRATVSLVLLGLGLALTIIVLAVVLSRRHAHCGPKAFAHAAVAADSKVCSDIGRAILQQQGSPVDATIAALVCTGVVNPQSMGLGGGVIFTIYNATTGKVEVINARETVPASHTQGLLDQCEKALPLGTGSLLTLQDLVTFQPEVVDALEMPLGNYTLYSPPPPAGGAILSFILNVLRGFNFSTESVAGPEGRVSMYHHLVETLKFARGQRWRLWDPRRHPEVQNASKDLLGEALAQHIRQQIDERGDHQLSHYNLAGAWGHRMGTSHVSVLGEDGSAVSATSTINTPFGAMVYSPRTGILLNNELLDLCWRYSPGSSVTPPPVPGERPPSSMVPSILVNKDQGSKLVIGGAGGELIISAVVQTIMNKLWLGFDLTAAIAAPILHVNDKGHVEYEPSFSQEVQKGLQDRGQNQTQKMFFLNVVQAVSQEDTCVYAVSDWRKSGEAAGY
ncbi:glutathione hydrolase 5 proenzyme isoform X3 [Sciurus carolinensis]|uniref:glutathione hydrolase 5 proenzyme isoform X3 n=1 Tax=Sciurus carolinensis TaxID=30640 RepID=UPI001FB49D62|nr:glutathione hydrolase 5 proenzyme isoform X3 [Sciurus carolinensis]